MKIYGFLILVVFSFAGCVPGKSDLAVKFKNKSESSLSAPSVSSVQIINNQLIINGVELAKVSSVLVNGNSLNETFSIESQTATKIIANSARAFSFDVSKVFNLILSNANASATFQIDFSLCNATLGGVGFDCSAPSNNDVLTFDQSSNKWMPKALSGISYKGTWDANTSEPVSTIVGQYYIVNVANPPTYNIGDWIVWDGSAYDVIAQSAAGGVSTIFGRSGAVIAVEGDYSLDKLSDVDLTTTPPTTGQVLKYNGTKWIADDEAGSPAAGSVTTTELADGSVTDAKIVAMATTKLTGTITSAQITDGAIVNADINAAAAIDYSKLNIPAASIPYAKLNIADGDIPAAKISGLPAATSILATTIVNADTTHAPDGNAVFDALGLKLNLTGGTLSIGTISGVPTPTNNDDVANKGYTDTRDALKLAKAGDTMTGALTLDSDLKIKGGSNYVTVKGHATSAAYNLTLPINGGTNGYVLSTDGSGGTSWVDVMSAVTNLDTDDVDEATNLYFTEARVLGTDLAGLNTGVNGPIAAADTVLGAMGKLQYQVSDLKANGQWVKTVNNISYGAGNVEINTKLRLKDTGTNFVELKAPATVTTTYTLTFPANDGNSNQVLRTDGAGVLTWVDITDSSVVAFARSALPTCAAGEVLKSNGTSFSCVTDNAGAGSFSGTASKAVVTGAGGALDVSATSATEIGYVAGVTSAIQTQLNSKEAAITAGTAAQYLNGEKDFITLDTSAVPENTRLYFTEPRVLATDLLGFVASNSAIVATDSVLIGLEKSQGQITNLGTIKANVAGDTFTGDVTLNTQLRLKDGTAGTYVILKAPSSGTATHTLTLPGTVGSSGQVLSMTGTAGVLAWTTPSSSVTLTGDVGGTSGATTIGTDKVTSTHVLDGTILNADINASAAIDYSKLNVPAAAIPLTALNATGTKDSTKYLKGDNTWAALTTDVLGTPLTGLTLTNAVITATDTVLSAFGKLQKQVTDSAVATMSGDLTGTLPSPTVAKIKGVAVSATAPADGQFFKYTTVGTNWIPSFVTVTDLKSTALGNLFPGTGCAANQTLYYSVVGDAFSCVNINSLDADKITTGTIAAARLPAGASYWVAATGGVNYAGGNVGIGATNPGAKLDVAGSGKADLFYAHGAGAVVTNTAYGLGALSAHTTGSFNTAIGASALTAITTSTYNTAVGTNALMSLTSGSGNLAIGPNSLLGTTTGGSNVGIGRSALAINSTGGNNVAVGTNSLINNTTAYGNTAVGDSTLQANTTGAQNVAVGNRALYANTTASNNISIGRNSLAGNTTGIGNVAMGFESGYTSTVANANVSGNYNTFLGFNSGPGSATQLTNSTAIGANATVTASNAIVLGDSAVKVGIGTTAPTGKLSIEGTGPVGMQIKTTGAGAVDTLNFINDMDANGNFWIAKGTTASAAPAAADKLVNITNAGNVEIFGQQVNASDDFSGVLSLKTQTSGAGGTKNEVSMEFYADRTSIATKSGYIGYESGTAFDMTLMNSKSANLIFGTNNTEKMRITTGGFVGIGNNNPTKALSVNGEIESLTVTATTVSAATVNAGSLAVQSGNAAWVVGGFRNTSADGYSGFQLLDNAGAIKGFMGFANPSAAILPGSIFYTSEGAGVPLILGANKVERLRVTDTGVGINGTNGAYNFYVNGTAGGTSAYVNASDRRLKKDIKTIPSALEKISLIRGVTYNWNHDVHPELALGHREEMGVIAQEVEKVFPDAVTEDKVSGIKSVAYSMLIAPLIEAVKSLNKLVTELFSTSEKHTREIASVKSDLGKKDQEIKRLQQENAEIKARLDRVEKMLNKK